VRTALITGGSGGIGKACGRRLAELGYDVVLTARREANLRAAADEIGARYVVGDAADPEAFPAVVAAIGPIDLLVHAAGVLGGTYARKQTFAQWRETMTANLDSCFVVTSAALPQMRPGSRFVFVSSSSAHEPMPARTAYSASKAGMNAFARALALEVDRDGINVHIVTPGPVETDMLQDVPFEMYAIRWIPRSTCPRSGSTRSPAVPRRARRSCRSRPSAAGRPTRPIPRISVPAPRCAALGSSSVGMERGGGGRGRVGCVPVDVVQGAGHVR
jgi:NAD(P)-dependent dehydrogenase (short-subunit alcohol dehydrogenase family)